MKWSVYVMDKPRSARNIRGLGYVYAPHMAAAVRRAEKRWPKETDYHRPPFGFIIRKYLSDPFNLGRPTIL